MKKILYLFLIICVLSLPGCKNTDDLAARDIRTDTQAATNSFEPIFEEPESEHDYLEPELEFDYLEPEFDDLEPEFEDPESDVFTPVDAAGEPDTQAPERITIPAVTALEFSPASDNDITLTAGSLLGLPFAAGGSGPNEGFDNSGFIYYVLRQNGFLSTPRRISEQSQMGDKIAKMSDLRSGDLVFFSTGGTQTEFGGIYIGDGIMIYSSQPGDVVKTQNINNDYWKSSFFIGIRVL